MPLQTGKVTKWPRAFFYSPTLPAGRKDQDSPSTKPRPVPDHERSRRAGEALERILKGKKTGKMRVYRGIRALPNNNLWMIFQATFKKDGIGDPGQRAEILRRRETASRLGNGIILSEKRDQYRNLVVKNTGGKEWSLEGEFFDAAAGRWRPFHYQYHPDEACRTLWTGKDLHFPSQNQERLIQQKLFTWAKKVA